MLCEYHNDLYEFLCSVMLDALLLLISVSFKFQYVAHAHYL